MDRSDPAYKITPRDVDFLHGSDRKVRTFIELLADQPEYRPDISTSTSLEKPSQEEHKLLDSHPLSYVSLDRSIHTLPDFDQEARLEAWKETSIADFHHFNFRRVPLTYENEAAGSLLWETVTEFLRRATVNTQGTFLPASFYRGGYCVQSTEAAPLRTKGGTDQVLAYANGSGHYFVMLEMKTDLVLLRHASSLHECFNQDFHWDPVEDANNHGKRILIQLWNCMIRYGTKYGLLLTPHVVYFLKRSPTDKPEVLMIDGPYVRRTCRDNIIHFLSSVPAHNLDVESLEDTSTSEVFLWIAKVVLMDSKDPSRTLFKPQWSTHESNAEPLQLLYGCKPPGWRSVLDAGWQQWASLRLAFCRGIIIHPIEGPPLKLAPRLHPSLSFSGPACLYRILTMLSRWIMPPVISNIVNVHMFACVAYGSNCVAYRGMFSTIPVIIKVTSSTDGVIEKEWEALTQALPPDPCEASRLPIPDYYGCFNVEGFRVMMTSDNGIPLQHLTGLLDKRYLVRSAVSSLRAAGIVPTDVEPRNCGLGRPPLQPEWNNREILDSTEGADYASYLLQAATSVVVGEYEEELFDIALSNDPESRHSCDAQRSIATLQEENLFDAVAAFGFLTIRPYMEAALGRDPNIHAACEFLKKLEQGVKDHPDAAESMAWITEWLGKLSLKGSATSKEDVQSAAGPRKRHSDGPSAAATKKRKTAYNEEDVIDLT